MDGRIEERDLRDAKRMGELEAASWLELWQTVGGQADVDAAPCPLVCRPRQTPQPTFGPTGVCRPKIMISADYRYRLRECRVWERAPGWHGGA
jgi:hypothetical protein